MSKDDDVKRFADELQQEIMDRVRKVYTETVIDHWQNPRNFHPMDRPDGHAKAEGSCGDTMEMFIRMEDDLITDCSFSTDGCATTIACGSMATEISIGKSFIQALAKVGAEEILKRLGGLPEADVHCAQLAAEAVRRAMADALYQKKQGGIMTECRKDKNLNECNCSYEPCSRKGVCCECLSYHWSMKELPACLFPDEVESTYDRSLRRFIEIYKDRI